MITRLKLINWKNFKSADVQFGKRVFIVGPNAAGKSNFLDSLRFLRDLVLSGGGLQAAINERGGLTAIRCLAARQNPLVEVAVTIKLGSSPNEEWTYELGIQQETRGKRKPQINYERVFQGSRQLLNRPDDEDKIDEERLYQTALEQTTSNKAFRDISKYLESIQYFHLVPQLLKYPNAFSGPDLPGDPFGRGFLEQLSKTSAKTRDSWLRSIEGALRIAVPQLSDLKYIEDAGKPHLQAFYRHWRPDAGKQDEVQFSDGTLRLIGLSWAMLQRKGPLLLEEPELSLNSAIVSRLPSILYNMQKKRDRQAFITTHSEAIFSDDGISLDEIIVLAPEKEGTSATVASTQNEAVTLLRSGLSTAEIIIPKTRPANVENLELDF